MNYYVRIVKPISIIKLIDIVGKQLWVKQKEEKN